MRVLVAGASGALGRSLLLQLSELGHEAVGVARVAGSLEGTGATELIADVSSRGEFLAAIDGQSVDAVINVLGASPAIPSRYHGMFPVNRLRVEGTSTLLAAARAMGATRFVGASAWYGYGFADHGEQPLRESAVFGEPDGTRNDDVLLAVLGSEQQVRAFGGVALRFGHLYAEGASNVPAVPRQWSGSLPVVNIADAARAAILALTAGAPGAAYNIAADDPATWRTLQEARARVDGFPAPVVLPDSVIRSLASFSSEIITRVSMRLSSSAARKDLGWVPEYPSLEDFVAKVR